MAFEELVEQEKYYAFYGVDNFHFKIGKLVFEAKENPSDGYRSYLESVVSAENINLIFYDQHLAMVKLVSYDNGEFQGHALVDKDGHEWLKIGTDSSDDYYPCFIFTYQPKLRTSKGARTMTLEDFQNTKLRIEFVKNELGWLDSVKIHSHKGNKVGYLEIRPGGDTTKTLKAEIVENKVVHRSVCQRGSVVSDLEGNEIRVDWEENVIN